MNKKYTIWNLTMLYKSDDDPQMQKDRETIKKNCKAFVKKWKHRTDYLNDPKILRQALDDYEEWQRTYEGGGKEWYYFHLRTEQEESNPMLRAKMNQVNDFKHTIDNELRFFQLSISKIPEKIQKKLLESKDLVPYHHYLERLFAQVKHLLSESEEKIMTLKSTPAYGNWVKMTSSFLSKEEKEVLSENGKKEKKSFSDIMSLINSPTKQVRDAAAKALNEIVSKYSDVATEEINSVLENKKIDDELRNMPYPDYSRHLSDDIDRKTVHTALAVVSKRNMVAENFYRLKAQLFGVPKLQYHERNVLYGTLTRQYSFEEATDIMIKVFGQLDSSFLNIFQQFVANGHFDIYPRKGKHSGAFCAYYLISQPTYVLLNHTNKLEDVLTLAHEMGHAINNELMKTKQHALHFGTPLATAEVASTFMEDFVLDEVVKHATDTERLSIMMMRLNSDVSTIFRQVACYRFEEKLHSKYRKNGYLSTENIGKLFQESMNGYMGKYVEQSPGSENWWVYWHHIRYFFYVYSYASGLLISKAMQNMVKQDKKNIIKVKEFLSAGLSDSPKNIFKNLNIDIVDETFWDRGIDEIENLLEDTKILAKKLGKIQ